MIESGSHIITFCCAKGLFRGPSLSDMVPGSSFVEGGYTGLAAWLRPKTPEEQVEDMSMFYSDALMVLIADQPDRDTPEFAKSLQLVSTVLASAGIQYLQTEYSNILSKICSEKIYPLNT